MKNKSVYCSGPLFSPEDIWAMNQIAAAIEEGGYDTFLPHRDGLEPFVTNFIGTPLANSIPFRFLTKSINKWVFAYDIYQIVEACDYLVLTMNGRGPDEGGIVETAVAYATGKPIVLYKADDRTFAFGSDHLMLLGASSAYTIVNTIEGIPSSLARLSEHMTSGDENHTVRNDLTPQLQQAAALGKKVHRFVRALQFLKPPNKLLEMNSQ